MGKTKAYKVLMVASLRMLDERVVIRFLHVDIGQRFSLVISHRNRPVLHNHLCNIMAQANINKLGNYVIADFYLTVGALIIQRLDKRYQTQMALGESKNAGIVYHHHSIIKVEQHD